MKDSVKLLQALIESGEFHHATYRCLGTVWEGLHYYKRDKEGFRGYSYAGCVNKSLDGEEAINEAETMLLKINHGISIGAYGQG